MVAIIATESTNKITSEKNISFRWTYIVLPLGILVLSIMLTGYFYRLLPAEAAYHFTNGSPDRWVSRGTIIAWLLIPQFVLALLGAAISGGTAKMSTALQQSQQAAVRKLLLLLGNMVALPQIILCFAMLEIFLYNAYEIHTIPLGIFALMVMVLGLIILGIFFIQAVREFRRLPAQVTGSNTNGRTDSR